MKCDECAFYLEKLDTCVFCHHTPRFDIVRCDEQTKEEFDILKLDDEDCEEWTHKKILKRLHNHDINCYFVDIWNCDTVAYIIGINAPVDKVAKVLGIHRECIYYDCDHSVMILNLFQEKVLREQ